MVLGGIRSQLWCIRNHNSTCMDTNVCHGVHLASVFSALSAVLPSTFSEFSAFSGVSVRQTSSDLFCMCKRF